MCYKFKNFSSNDLNLFNKIEIFKRIKSQKKLLVIDDLVDSGETAKIVKSMMPNRVAEELLARARHRLGPSRL